MQLLRVNPNGTVTKRDVSVDLAAEVNEETNPILKNNDVIIVNRNVFAAIGDGFETVFGPIGRTFSIYNLFNNAFYNNNNNRR